MSWFLLKAFAMKEKLYTGYNSLLCDNITKALYTALPVLHGSPTDTSNLNIALKIA